MEEAAQAPNAKTEGDVDGDEGQTEQGGSVGVRKGRFWVTTDDTSTADGDSPVVAGDGATSAPVPPATTQESGQEAVAPAPNSVDVRKKGRFVVFTEVDQDDEDDFTADEAGSQTDLNRISMSSLTSLATNFSEVPTSFLSQTDSYTGLLSAGQGLAPIPGLPSYQASVFEDSLGPSSALAEGMDISSSVVSPNPNLGQGGAAYLQSHQMDGSGGGGFASGNMPSVQAGAGGLPPTNKQHGNLRKATPSTIMFELQKISAQNRKLHKMLLELSGSKNVRPGAKGAINPETGLPTSDDTTGAGNGVSSYGISTGLSSSAGGEGEGAESATLGESSRRAHGGSIGVSAGVAVSGSSQGVSKVPVPSVGSTSRMQELVGELNSNTINLITEYDALKMRNFVLTKQLKDVKQQLKEANLKIENLKQALGKGEVFSPIAQPGSPDLPPHQDSVLG